MGVKIQNDNRRQKKGENYVGGVRNFFPFEQHTPDYDVINNATRERGRNRGREEAKRGITRLCKGREGKEGKRETEKKRWGSLEVGNHSYLIVFCSLPRDTREPTSLI